MKKSAQLSAVMILIVMTQLSVCLSARAESAPSQGRFGNNSAVTDFDKEEGFKLSERAIKSLGISFQRLNEPSRWRIPKQAIVNFKHSTAVYRRFQGWIALVLVKINSADKDNLIITSEDLQPGDDVAVSGTQFLRMTDLDVNSDTVDTCSH